MQTLRFFCLFCLVSSSAWAEPSIWTLTSTPASETFNGISAPNNTFAIAVGKAGEIVHFVNGDHGTLMSSGTSKELFDVYASSPNLAVATGREIVLLWNGESWTTILDGDPDSVYTGAWISPEEDVVLYQSLGTFNIICPHLPGEVEQPWCRAWRSPMLTACGNSDDIKMITADGNIYHIDNFLGDINGPDPLHDQSPPLGLTAVWAPDNACIPGPIAPLELFAINNTDEFWHFDGSSWSLVEDNVPAEQTLSWLDGTGPGNIVAVGFEPDGGSGNQGVIWHYNGSVWTEDTNLPDGTPGLTDVAANILFENIIFEGGFESAPGNGAASGNGGSGSGAATAGTKVDILASAENGSYLSTATLFPSSATDLQARKKLLTSGPVRTGDRITFRLSIENHGPDRAQNVRFLDGYSAFNLRWLSGDCGMSLIHDEPSWHYREVKVAALEVGEVISCTMEFEVTGSAGGKIVNRAAVFGRDDLNSSNNSEDIRITISE